MSQPKRRNISSYIFASFFGAAMVASAFAYFNFKFSQYRFIDFNEFTFYQKGDIFVPTEKEYLVIVFSSNMQNIDKIKSYYKDIKILAVDMYQKRYKSEDNITFVSSGMNTLLEFIQKFNIYAVPSAFIIVKQKNNIYKQDSSVQAIK